MSHLYEITNEIFRLQRIIEDEELDPMLLADTFETLEGEFEVKLENCCKVIKNLQNDIAGIKAEADRLTARRKSYEKNIENLKTLMFNAMTTTGIEKVKGQLFTVSIQNNGGVIPINYDKENKDITRDLPDELVNIVETPNLDAIRTMLEAGKTVTGFSLGERGKSLRIK